MADRKMFSVAVPEGKADDIEDLKADMKRVIDLARIHNKKSTGRKYPENVAELILYGMTGVCEKLSGRLEGKISEEEIEKMEKSREYLREYYRDYRGKDKKEKTKKKV